MRMILAAGVGILCSCVTLQAAEPSGNRLTYLDGPCNPYYVSGEFAKLTTPQWVGEPGVEAVVVLAIDDMRDDQKYEQYLRPILQRLKEIDGRAPVSIMTCSVKPELAHLQSWLAEGLSLEIHTVDHPCPLLHGNDFAKAKSTYDRCIDLMHTIPGNVPVAYRMPCCDSLNTVSPRFFTEIFNKTTAGGHYLSVDTSVFNVFTPDDAEIPRELLTDPDGKSKFQKYVPYDRSFVNTVDNYPYPYVIDRLCWEFPCLAPSDWSAQHLHKPFNPETVRDFKAALDITVVKQGTLNMVFHPHGWIRNDQMVDLIDHADSHHGKQVKFLTFREAQDRLNKHLLDGHPLRLADGSDSGVRLLDVDNDGYLDVVIPDEDRVVTKVWSTTDKQWERHTDRFALREPHFGVLHRDGRASVLVSDGKGLVRRDFRDGGWKAATLQFDDADGGQLATHVDDLRHISLRDLDNDGICELFLADGSRSLIYRLADDGVTWICRKFTLPEYDVMPATAAADTGLRFFDLNADGFDDVLISDAAHFAVHLYESSQTGWSRTVVSEKRNGNTTIEPIPMIVREDGTNNGAWFHSGKLWIQNEDTAKLKDLVDRRSFQELVQGRLETTPSK